MSDILDPDKWGLLHQEGVTLVEQAVRKLQDGDCPLDYAERTVSRIDNLILEYTKELDGFNQQVENNRKKLSLIPAHEAVDRGPNNLYHSKRDVQVAYDGLISLFTDEFHLKLHSLFNIRSYYQHHIEQLAFKNASESSNPEECNGATQSTLSTVDISGVQAEITQYPWIQQTIDKVRLYPEGHIANPNDPKLLPFLMNQKHSCNDKHEDLNGLVEIFEHRQGFDSDAAQRLARIITDSNSHYS